MAECMRFPGMYMSFVYILITLCACLQSTECKSAVETDDDFTQTIIIFGGNGLIGASTVENLLRANYSLVLINRGNWYWDTAETVKPFVTHIKCDRMQSLQRCAGFQHYLWSIEAPSLFEAVIDFSAYHVFQLTDSLRMLTGKVKRYIYISSDSVYEVCNKTHTALSREEDAVRPTSAEDQEAYSQKDSYGNRKLQCEEELQKQADTKNGIPYVALRLPDVIGPRDNTYRWWIYQLWIRLSNYLNRPLSVPVAYLQQPLSLVFVDDVSALIVDLISRAPELYNQAYNLAMTEQPSLVQVLQGIMSVLDLDDIPIQTDDSDEPFHLFPSVTLGPVDTTKAVRMLNWKPTPWLDVLDATVTFYERAIINTNFYAARKEIVRTLQEHFTNDPVRVVKGLQDVYKLDVYGYEKHDEL